MSEYKTEEKTPIDVEAQKEHLRAQAKMLVKEQNQLAEIQKNAELAQMYTENAQVGAQNLSGELPLLKVHATGKSSKNELSDGTEPQDGWFFYKPTGEQFEELNCHILTISKGFRAPGIEETGTPVFNQIMGGVIIEGRDYKPFIIYLTGKKLQPMWDFGKVANKYTHAKPVPIPMFALTVKLTTHKEANSYGKSWLIDFEIQKDETGQPVLITDPGEFQFLKDNVETVEATIASIIEAKTGKDTTKPTTPDGEGEVVAAEDIPF